MRHQIHDDPLFDIISNGRRGPCRRDLLSLSQVEQITRTAGRTPEVMVKVLPASGGSMVGACRHLDYIGRHGEVDLLTDDDQALRGADVATDLTVDWDLDLEGSRRRANLGAMQGRPPPKLVHKLVFSMPAGTAPDKVLKATHTFCREEFGLKHRYVAALHTDEPHPHVHVVVKAMSEQGMRLHIRKATLRSWREKFAHQLRAVGVAANATPRFVRGETQPRKTDGIYRATRRGASAHIRERVLAAAAALGRGGGQIDPAKARLEQGREALQRGWGAAIESLEAQGEFNLASRARKFAAGLPPARTEREWVMEGPREQVRVQRGRVEELVR